MRIVLDAMGSDTHPTPEVHAAVEAANTFGDEIILVGNEEVVGPLLAEANTSNAPVRVVHAPETFDMTEKIGGAQALRTAQNSIGIGIDLVKNGEADAIVSAGNTGGTLALGLARLGRIRGVKRPALTAPFPTKGGITVLADIGANPECKPEYLLQFAQMGVLYAETVLGIKNPRVGLFSNGEEEGKGNDLTKAAYSLLKESGLNFFGNIEGKEFYGGEVDVAITDGFTGNVILKTNEAMAKFLLDELKGALKTNPLTMLGAMLAKPAFNHLKSVMDPADIGAVPLLGLDGLVFVAHGRAKKRDLVSAIRSARVAVDGKLLESIRASIKK